MPRNIPDVQLSLFDLTSLEVKPTNPVAKDIRPLPLIIADKWGFKLQYQDVDSVRYYAVQDWVCGLTETADARNTIAGLKRRSPELCSTWIQLKYKAADSKSYRVSFADDENLYGISQRLDKSTGAVDAVLKFLAKSGKILDRARTNPAAADNLKNALDAQHGKLRKDSTIGRNDYTAATVETHHLHKPKIGLLTDENYKALFGLAKRQLCMELGLDPEAKDLRDHLNNYALLAITATETHAAALMRRLDRLLTDDEQITVGRRVAAQFKPVFEAAAIEAGEDLTTPRLTDGK